MPAAARSRHRRGPAGRQLDSGRRTRTRTSPSLSAAPEPEVTVGPGDHWQARTVPSQSPSRPGGQPGPGRDPDRNRDCRVLGPGHGLGLGLGPGSCQVAVTGSACGSWIPSPSPHLLGLDGSSESDRKPAWTVTDASGCEDSLSGRDPPQRAEPRDNRLCLAFPGHIIVN